ncbi:PqiC family protein [Gluconacetobacter entanii]|uniref:PqiC family protein n=1 Tax=Gluconacetobacter entanii TaxID=108528 RepID=A0ABT3K7R8_9PROT|nr:PqiC family protein [Gluconacetobacter entanii]MCW4591475.1 PqiC family protein [Gluconacetobacter entanii]MCW4593942.1 PqiC family protein [Gluconacetobacter entanii]
MISCLPVFLSRHMATCRAMGGLIVSASLLAACSSAPVKFYTLGASAIATGATTPSGSVSAVTDTTPVIQVEQARIPDYLDGQDILVRDGHEIERSSLGRWASRLSVGATDLVTARLAQKWPDRFVTDQPQPIPASWRLAINISRLDVSRNGAAALNADWAIIPQDLRQPIARNRTHIEVAGGTATNNHVAEITESLLDQLSDKIAASWPQVTATHTSRTHH